MREARQQFHRLTKLPTDPNVSLDYASDTMYPLTMLSKQTWMYPESICWVGFPAQTRMHISWIAHSSHIQLSSPTSLLLLSLLQIWIDPFFLGFCLRSVPANMPSDCIYYRHHRTNLSSSSSLVVSLLFVFATWRGLMGEDKRERGEKNISLLYNADMLKILTSKINIK